MSTTRQQRALSPPPKASSSYQTIDINDAGFNVDDPDDADIMNQPDVKELSDIIIGDSAPQVGHQESTADGDGGASHDPNTSTTVDGPTNGWTQSIEVYVSSISIKCKDYRNIHEGSTIYYDKRSSYFTIFLIFVSFMVSAISLIPFFNGEVFKYVIALLSVFTTTLTTVNKFLKYQENSTKHRLASQKFLELHRNITEQFLLPFADRTNGKRYLTLVGRSFDQIIKTAPYPPEAVKTRKKLTSTPDTDIKLQSRFDMDTNVTAVPNPDPPTIGSEVAGSIAPQGVLQIPQSAPIQTVNPAGGAGTSNPTTNGAGGHVLSAMAKWQLQRQRADLDNFSGDYD